MEASAKAPDISLENAYEEINFYSANSKARKPIATYSNGPANFAGLFSSNATQHKIKSNQEEIFMCAQPFYVGEVDHNIEEIGLMAVKEVRYVDDDQWEEIMRENQRYNKALQKEKSEEVRMVRKMQATARQRNQKGQFIPKGKPVKKKAKKQKKKVKSSQQD